MNAMKHAEMAESRLSGHKKRAKEENALIFWSDETGIRSSDCNGRGYAPKGKTPIKKVKGTIEEVNMINAITNQGTVRFKFYEGTLKYETG